MIARGFALALATGVAEAVFAAEPEEAGEALSPPHPPPLQASGTAARERTSKSGTKVRGEILMGTQVRTKAAPIRGISDDMGRGARSPFLTKPRAR
jgi:hypothetical protein